MKRIFYARGDGLLTKTMPRNQAMRHIRAIWSRFRAQYAFEYFDRPLPVLDIYHKTEPENV